MQSAPSEDFSASLKCYFNNTTLSDATIRCGGKDIAVHSLILYCHSEYFRKQLDGPWKESSDRVIEIADFDLTVVAAMTHFFYFFNYKAPADSSDMIFHAKVYQIADKYGIEALKKLSAIKYQTSIKAGWKLPSFPDAIELAYTTTPPGDERLRTIAVEAAMERIGTLMNQDAFCNMLSANSDVAINVIRRLHRESEKSRVESEKSREESETFSWNQKGSRRNLKSIR